MGQTIRLRKRLARGCAIGILAASSLVAGGVSAANASAGPTPAVLQAARVTLAQRLVPDTSVGVDTVTHHLVLTIGSAARRTAPLLFVARRLGSMVRIYHVRGAITTAVGHVEGGDGIADNTDGIICSMGFNVSGGHILTAGHCAAFRGPWVKESTGALIGPAIDSEFPGANGTDFGEIKDKGGLNQPGVIQGYDIGNIPVTGAANPFVGESVCKSGRTTERTCGQVLAVDVTVTYSDGVTVNGMTQTNVCVQPGDSGGPLYDGGTGLGLTSAVAGDCATGVLSYFQPLIPALNFYGDSLITS